MKNLVNGKSSLCIIVMSLSVLLGIYIHKQIDTSGTILVLNYSSRSNTRRISIVSQLPWNSEKSLQRITPANIDVTEYIWSNKKKKIYMICENDGQWKGICEIELSGRRFRKIFTFDELGIDEKVWDIGPISPNGDYLVLINKNSPDSFLNGLYIFNILNREYKKVIVMEEKYRSIVWAPDNEQIVFLTSEDEIYLLNSSTQEVYYIGLGISPVWSVNSNKLAFSTWDTVSVVDLERNSRETFQTKSVCIQRNGLAWSPGGEKILLLSVCEENDPNYGFYLLDLDSEIVKKLHSGRWHELIISPLWVQ